MAKTKITIDYSKCGPEGDIDPRDCSKCLQICDPAVFLRHQVINVKHENPYDPQIWQITAVWLSRCTRCLKCIKTCPEKAITVSWR